MEAIFRVDFRLSNNSLLNSDQDFSSSCRNVCYQQYSFLGLSLSGRSRITTCLSLCFAVQHSKRVQQTLFNPSSATILGLIRHPAPPIPSRMFIPISLVRVADLHVSSLNCDFLFSVTHRACQNGQIPLPPKYFYPASRH